MKTNSLLLFFFFFLFFEINLNAQLDLKEYDQFKSQTQNLTSEGLNSLYPRPENSYYKGYNNTPDFKEILYLDSATMKLELSNDELNLLKDNHFVVTSRLNYSNFGTAMHTVYANDLPLFISTDAILHALHSSYDFLLKTIEDETLRENLEAFTKKMYENFPQLITEYQGKGIDECLEDVDLYLTVAYSLITDTKQPLRLASQDLFDEVMAAIEAEKATALGMFCYNDRTRSYDFSQFKVRGHYVYTEEDKWNGFHSLEPYFRTMMWLGRIDLFLTAPEPNPWEEPWQKNEIRRMNMTAFMLNQLYIGAENKELMEFNEKTITYMVGESDNVNPAEINEYYQAKEISSANEMLMDAKYNEFYDGLSLNEDFTQKIMGSMLFVNPMSDRPDVLPVSYKLSGQRFIIDSYVFSNVVYDRIVYNGKKVNREMPDPLDFAFALGNSDALHFLQSELNRYPYAANLANLRYLIDQKEDSFWTESLYNSWLGAIRTLNPEKEEDQQPFFMKTSAWHQQKLNTQLASWTQLRHDNLLYAKPSYTGMTGCSYPYAYVEPYPEFYKGLATFSHDAGQFFSSIENTTWGGYQLKEFFPKFAEIMDQLAILAQKELDQQLFSAEEQEWLKSALFESGGSGAPPYSGWYNNLYLNPDDIIKEDYIVVDLHTQPTDSLGNMVGKVLHTGTGKINLGTFIIKNPECDQYVAYTGPFYSYYQDITKNFFRYTDQDWASKVEKNDLPDRPEWTNIYLADNNGNKKVLAMELPSSFLVGLKDISRPDQMFSVYPNPVDNELFIQSISSDQPCFLQLFDLTGHLIEQGIVRNKVAMDFSSYKKGLYLLKIRNSTNLQTFKIVKN
ncbi:MAG: DUF3160 domain-containing protein [Prolixibacteraceae bacterium]